MTRPFIFHRLAELELNEAAGYYEREQPGLGSAFLRAIEQCLAKIGEYPESGRLVLGDVRRRLVRQFPYAVLYRITPDALRILACMHLSRRPFYWADRR